MIEYKERYSDKIIGGLISAIVHAVAVISMLLFCDVRFVPDSDEASMLDSEMLVVPVVAAQPPEPLSPPDPAPPAPPEPPEPPEPDPVPPEPPEPDPAPPAPPEPEPVPPKPEPIPEPPKPEPIPEPPKPQPIPEPPKPQPVPTPPKPVRRSIADRLKNAQVRHVNPQPSVPPVQRPVVRATSREDLNRRLGNTGQPAVGASAVAVPRGLTRRFATSAEESVNYAEQVVKPQYYQAWNTPRIGDRRPSPVVVELDVQADGRVLSARITRRSSDPLMNESVEELIRTVRQFTAFRDAGVKSTSLHIVVTMEIVE